MSADVDVTIVGAGPYGLSLAAHLAAAGIGYRIVGDPMLAWRDYMPRGMLLKSEGFASSLADPLGQSTLRQYCAECGLDYADVGIPVPLANFLDYGLTFQKRHVPQIEAGKVEALESCPDGFSIKSANCGAFTTRRAVIAVGIVPFRHMPPELARLPAESVSHSTDHSDLTRFAGRRVAVIGGGASAVDIAALLHENGADVELIVRSPVLPVHTRMRLPRPLRDRLRHPNSAIGASWRSLFYSTLPGAFHRLPEVKRLDIVRRHLGPAGGWFMRDRIDKVATLTGVSVGGAEIAGERIVLKLVAEDGAARRLEADHVICATGFRPDLQRLGFLDARLQANIAQIAQTPILDTQFQSSIPGLYFVGPIAANSFGPVMRFVAGAGYAARRISRHLAPGGQNADLGLVSRAKDSVTDLAATTGATT